MVSSTHPFHDSERHPRAAPLPHPQPTGTDVGTDVGTSFPTIPHRQARLCPVSVTATPQGHPRSSPCTHGGCTPTHCTPLVRVGARAASQRGGRRWETRAGEVAPGLINTSKPFVVSGWVASSPSHPHGDGPRGSGEQNPSPKPQLMLKGNANLKRRKILIPPSNGGSALGWNPPSPPGMPKITPAHSRDLRATQSYEKTAAKDKSWDRLPGESPKRWALLIPPRLSTNPCPDTPRATAAPR